VLIALGKDHMFLEEWQSISIESSIDAPVCSKCSVVFLCLVNNSEFIQLVREGLIGVHRDLRLSAYWEIIVSR